MKNIIFFLLAAAGTAQADIAPPQRATAALGEFSLSMALIDDRIWLFELSPKKADPGRPFALSPMIAPLKGRTPRVPSSDDGRIWTAPASSVVLDPAAGLITVNQADGQPLLSLAPYTPDGRLAGLIFQGPFSHLLGLGADFRQQNDVLNLLGQVILPGGPFGNARLDNWRYRPNQVQIPVVYGLGRGLACGALFIDATLPWQWNFKTRPWTVTAAGPLAPDETLRFFVLTGPDLAALRSDFMGLIGRPPVPPIKMMGVWVSGLKEALAPKVAAEELEADLEEPVEAAPPAPSKIMELKEKIAKIRELAPNFSGLTAGLDADIPALMAAAKETETGLILDESARVAQYSPHYPEMARRSFLVRAGGPQGRPLAVNYRGRLSGLVDYTDEAAAAFWHSLAREKLTDEGQVYFRLLDGELEDVGPDAWYAGSGDASPHSHYVWANAYALKWLEGVAARLSGWRHLSSRPVLMTRTGAAGLGRHSGFLYNGETSIFAGGFIGLSLFGVRSHLALAGVDYYSADLTSSLAAWPVERFFQNYDAWLAKSALTDFPLILPEELLARPACQYNLALRESLAPYIYSLAWRAYLEGRPATAPLVYYFQDDLKARDRLPELMLGPDLLLSLNLDGVSERAKVYVPRGRWYNWRTGEVIEQETGGELDMDTKAGGHFAPPILVRGGAIIPAVEYMHPKDGLNEKIAALKIFIGRESSETVWYEDDGYSQRYRLGDQPAFGRTVISAVTQPDGSTVVTIKAREGSWSEAPAEKNFLIDIYGPQAPGQAALDNLSHNRVAQTSALDRMESGWASFGQNRIRFKTPPLDLSVDHVLWFK